ncbi:hypothetical protein GQX73_g655 [Xylaria multiplex]|uniref:Uncharacterized protein n=1 Tax=Xylaria multiplex TaxID=323545 RepID=A0A7C8IV56_9PEZI|nr:hypothetical protein GQX73_g655 [Xylaria multiplex]
MGSKSKKKEKEQEGTLLGYVDGRACYGCTLRGDGILDPNSNWRLWNADVKVFRDATTDDDSEVFASEEEKRRVKADRKFKAYMWFTVAEPLRAAHLVDLGGRESSSEDVFRRLHEKVAPPGTPSYGSAYQPLWNDEDQLKPSPNASIEKRKVALTRDVKCLAFLSHFLLHLIPLAATATAVQLSLRQVYWADDAMWDSKWYLLNLSQQATMDFLQFAAKLHEILIVASLSAIILHFLRRKLVGKNGLPLGILGGAYQVGSIEYFFSKSFQRPLFSNLISRQLGTWVFILFLGMSIIYANLVGPASAVALEPSLDWWSIPDPFNTSSQVKSYILKPFDTVYPLELRNSTQNSECADWDGRLTGFFCPDGGFFQLIEWVLAWRFEGITYSPTMANVWGHGRRNISTTTILRKTYTGLETVVLSTTLLAEVLSLVDGFWLLVHGGTLGSISKVQRLKLTTSKETPIFMPLLQTQCTAWDYTAAISDFNVPTPGLPGLRTPVPYSPGIEFETSLLTNFSGPALNRYLDNGWKVPENAWNFTRPMDAVNVTWIGASDLKSFDSRSISSSLGVLVTIPYFYELHLQNGSSTTGQGSLLVPCIVDARWAAAEMIYDPNGNDVVGHNLTDLSKFVVEDTWNSRQIWGLSEPITISPDYVSLIDSKNLTRDDQQTLFGQLIGAFVEDRWINASVNDGAVTKRIIQHFVPGNKTIERETYISETCKTIATILGTALADGISRHGLQRQNLGVFFSPKPDGQISYINLLKQAYLKVSLVNSSILLDSNVPINFDIERYGWGYGFNSPTAKFAIAVLLVHAIIVILYFAYYITFWLSDTGWKSKAWGSIEELLALAINSRPTEQLRNTGAGIDLSSTIMLPVRVRERHGKHQHMQAELIVGERDRDIYNDEALLKVGRPYA